LQRFPLDDSGYCPQGHLRPVPGTPPPPVPVPSARPVEAERAAH